METKELELNQDEVTKEVANIIKDGVINELKDSLVSSVQEIVKEATEKTIKKEVEDEKADPNKKEEEEEEEEEKIEETPEVKARLKAIAFGKAAVALARGDFQTVNEYNQKTMELRQKAGYGNTTTDADGGYLVPDPDFDAAVERLEEEYGIAASGADVRRINSNSVKLNKKSGGFELTETNQAGVKPGVKFTIGQVTADLRKFTGIAPATDELEEDAAVDYWNEVAKEFAMAKAKKEDELVFTDATSGVLEISGTAAQTIGNANTDLDWDDLLDAEVKVPSPSQKNGKWYLHRTVWQKLIQTKDDENRYQFQPNPSNATTPWGTPVVLTEVLPSFGNIGANEAFGVFGDLKHYKLYVKNGLQLTILREGIVSDADGVDFNLATQDGKALRGVVRMLAVAKFPEAFCLLGTGSVS